MASWNLDVGEVSPTRRLDGLLFSALPVVHVLQGIVELGQGTVPRADHVSVILMAGDHGRTVACTGETALALDERQYTAGCGPCTDAALSGRTIAVALDQPDNDYAVFSAAGRRLGVLHTLSVALPVVDQLTGSLNFYSHSAQPFDQDGVELAEVIASYTAVVLLHGSSYDATADRPEEIRHAFRARHQTETALGVLMARNNWTSEQAAAELHRRAERQQQRLSEAAQSIVDDIARATSPAQDE